MVRDARRRLRLDPPERRQQLLDAGLALLDANGDPPSAREVAERAGVTPGLLYRYFPDRRAFREALLLEAAGRLSAAAPRAEHASDHALHDTLRAEIEFAARHPGWWSALRSAPSGIRSQIDEHRAERMLRGRRTSASARARVLVRGWLGLCQASIDAWLEHREPAPAELAWLLAAALEPTLAGGDPSSAKRRPKPRVRLVAAARPPAP